MEESKEVIDVGQVLIDLKLYFLIECVFFVSPAILLLCIHETSLFYLVTHALTRRK